MPLSPNIAAQYADGVAEAYRDAELDILRAITRSLAEGIDTPEWQLRALARAQAVRQQTIGILARVNPIAASRMLADITDAYSVGQASVLTDIRAQFPALSVAPTLQGQAAVVGLVADARDSIGSTESTILRAVDDVYREVTRRATAATLTGGSQKTAVQRTLNTLLGKGLNGITTQSGRTMGLGDYVTMAVRTAVARSAFAGAEDTMGQAGLDLCRVLPGPRACDICDRWARQVLARRGPAGKREVRDVVNGGTIVVDVDDTLAAAKRGGWGHPNCRCSLEPFIPGVTRKTDLIERPPWDEDGYKAQQQQRGIERQVRAWKTREAIAIDPADQAAARRQVRAYQARMRDHLAANPELKRQGSREQISGSLTGNPRAARSAIRPERTPVVTPPREATRQPEPRPAPTPHPTPAPRVVQQAPHPAPRQAPQSTPRPARPVAVEVPLSLLQQAPPTPKPRQPAKAKPKTKTKAKPTRANAGSVSPEVGRAVAALAESYYAGRMSKAEYKAAVRRLTGTDSRGQQRRT